MNIGDSGGRGQDFDINLAPIIDCFTVLITFMLASASFLAIGIFETNISGPGQAAVDAKPPAISLEVELQDNKDIVFRVSGKATVNKRIPASAGDYDSASLMSQIEEQKRKFPDTTSVTLSGTDNTEYLHIIRMMEILKKHVATTLLGGI